jgi:hypothetical protein
MAVTYDELQKKTVAELRDLAKGIEHEAVQGYTQLHKEQLIPAICTALGIDAHEHHRVVDGFDKSGLKARLRTLRSERDTAIELGDHERLHAIRRECHTLNHRIRAHTV